MRAYWISWYHDVPMGGFELLNPWWISGEEGGGRERPTLCAAVMAADEDGAKQCVLSCYDDPVAADEHVQWRFVEERSEDWSPFSGRFPKADWMIWPPIDTTEDS